MIYVRIELWPGGRRSAADLLYEVRLANDETGGPTVSHYDVELSPEGGFALPGAVHKSCVVGFLRHLGVLSKLETTASALSRGSTYRKCNNWWAPTPQVTASTFRRKC